MTKITIQLRNLLPNLLALYAENGGAKLALAGISPFQTPKGQKPQHVEDLTDELFTSLKKDINTVVKNDQAALYACIEADGSEQQATVEQVAAYFESLRPPPQPAAERRQPGEPIIPPAANSTSLPPNPDGGVAATR